MYLTEDYILANELVDFMGVNISNISGFKKQMEEEDDEVTIISMGSCSFINRKSPKLNNIIRRGLESSEEVGFEFTNFSDKLPSGWFRDEFGINDSDAEKCGFILEKVRISNKDFFVFSPEFIEKTRGQLLYVLPKAEAEQLYKERKISGIEPLNNKRHMTWYNPRKIIQY